MIFGMKYLCLLDPQTGRQEVRANWNFLLALGFQKKLIGGGNGGSVGLKDILFKKTLELLSTYFIKKLKPWSFYLYCITLADYCEKKPSPPEIVKICVILLGNFTFFLGHPWIFYKHILFLQYTWKWHTFNPPFFFFLNAHCTLLKLVFSKVLQKKTDVRSCFKLNVGNYLIDEISRTTFLHCLPREKLTFVSQNKFCLVLKQRTTKVCYRKYQCKE